MSSPQIPSSLTRRRALAGATTVGLALPVLSACGDESGPSASDPGTSPPTSQATSQSTSAAPSEPTAETTSGAPAAEGLVSTADVPVGSGVIFADEQVVVTQPTAGEFKCFSAVCTHTGCTVAGISDVITCPCHGSTFDLATGDVLGGPAPSALPAVDFSVDGDQVVLS